MRCLLLATALFLAVPFPSLATTAEPTPTAPTPPTSPARDENLPPSEQQAKAALEKSPRHGEYVDVKLPPAGRRSAPGSSTPSARTRRGVVIVIHEIFGSRDWLRGVADQLARDGFIAVAPDLISGMGPNGGGTDSAASRDDVVEAGARAHARGRRPPA